MNPILKAVRKFRRDLGLERSKHHEAILRRSRTGKLDTRDKMACYFAQFWPLEPEKSSAKARTVDLMALLEPFSPAEQRAIAKRVESIQLTQGCNGGCFFCSFGPKNGVTAKFSFESLERFLETYGKFTLGGQGFALYHDSDPFDYRDGRHDFLDVFRLATRYGRFDNFISTALPVGSEASFVRFVEEVVEAGSKCLNIRISVLIKNASRFETVLALIVRRLRAKGWPVKKIDRAFAKLFEVAPRLERGKGIRLAGANLISEADPLKDSCSLGCADGVVLTPETIKAVAVVAVSRFHPSGEAEILLTPGKTIHRIPDASNRDVLLSVLDPVGWYLAAKARRPYSIFLPLPLSAYRGKFYLVFAEAKELSRSQKYSLTLSRVSESLRHFLEFVGELSFRRVDPGSVKTTRYLRTAGEVWHKDVRKVFAEILSGAEETLNSLGSGNKKDELAYFVTTTRANIALTNSMFTLVQAKLTPLAITYMAYKLGQLTMAKFNELDAHEGGIAAWTMEYGREADRYLKDKRARRKKRRKTKKGDPQGHEH